MKLREQFALDTIIKERAASLARHDLQNNHEELTRRAKVLAALIECQETIEEIMAPEAMAVEMPPRIGDINLNLGNNGAPKGFQPFDGGDIAASLKKELRTRTESL